MENSSLPEIQWKGKTFVIGLTGGIASGKSTAAEIFQKAGIRVLNADMIAAEVFNRKEIQEQMISRFGNSILEKGTVSRKKVAELVFNSPEKLAALNALIHPEVKKEFMHAKENLASGEILVYDVPLLFETGRPGDYDLTITVSAGLEIRRERAMKRNGWSEQEFNQRENAQIPLSEKEKKSDFVLKNDGSLSDLETEIFNLLKIIREKGNIQVHGG